MSSGRLALPHIAAGQAQKHVTHNEALLGLDALVHLSAVTRSLATPPQSPQELDRFIIPAGATDAWQDRTGQIAARQDGVWSYFTPVEGWRCWVADEATLLVWRSGQWSALPAAEQSLRLGINATADSTNRLAVSSPAALFTHAGSDHRLTINKAASAQTGSIVFQTNFSGRAEIGLTGSDALEVKVSPDGTLWRTAISVDPATGRVTLPDTPVAGQGESLLLNGRFNVNQRGFAGGALANGAYGPDRWRASGAAQLTVGAGAVQLNGEIAQTIESSLWQHGGLGGTTLTLCVDTLAGAPLTATVGGQSQTLPPGPGVATATFVLAANAPDALVVALSGAGASFRQVQLVRGGAALPFAPRPASLETWLCQRYAQVITANVAGPMSMAMAQTQTRWLAPITLPQALRGTPSISASGASRIYNAGGAFSPVNAVSLAALSRHAVTLGCDIDTSVGAGVGMLYAMTPAPKFVIESEY